MTDSETSTTVCWKFGAAMDPAPSFLGAGEAYCPSCGAYPPDERRKKKAKMAATLAIAVAAGILVLVIVRPGAPRTSKEPSEPAPRPPAASIESQPAAPAPAIIALRTFKVVSRKENSDETNAVHSGDNRCGDLDFLLQSNDTKNDQCFTPKRKHKYDY